MIRIVHPNLASANGSEPGVRCAEHGFTIVELMVSLLIFAMLAAAGVALLGFSVRAQQATAERLDENAALQRARAILTADLAQAAPRITRDREGARVPAFAGGTGAEGEVAMAFVRRGWSNPDGAPRAGLQRIEYRLVGDRIERRAYPMLDGAEIGPPSVVIANVSGLKLRYRVGAEWLDRWDSIKPDAIPQVVEAVIRLPRYGAVRQLFLTGMGL